MIQLVVYFLLVSTLIGFAASISERILGGFGLVRRPVWLFALLVSALLPVWSVLSDSGLSRATPILSLPSLPAAGPIAALGPRIDSVIGGASQAANLSWPHWHTFDPWLIGLWLFSSLALLVWLAIGFRHLQGIVKRSSRRSIGGHAVLVSESLGPAVIGFLRPRVVLPAWLVIEDAATTSTVLEHEREHIAARDPVLLLLALLVVATMPWNIAIWWQFRRLRCAIEIDCDNRVIQRGADPRRYSQVLLSIGTRSESHPPRPSLIAMTLTEPRLDLERRISIMMDCLPKLGLTGVGARLLLVTSLIGLAIAINVPRAQQPVGGSNNPTDWNAISAAQRSAVSHLLNEANLCLAADDLDCVHSNLDELNEFTDLSVLETVSVKQFQANVGYLIDEPILSIVAYEEIIALPTEDAFASLARTATRNLATLYFQNGRPDDAFAMYDRYMTLPGTSPSARDYYGLAAMLYQADRFADAIDPLKQAIALSEEPNKQYYSVLYVAQSETGDEAGMLDTIEKLNAYWPDESSAALAALSNPEAAPAYLRSIGQYLPMNSIQPMYPPDAIARGIEGSVLVQYTVGTDGSTKDVEVLESSSEIFEAAAIEAARQYEYRQRTIDGTPVEVAGVKTLIEFALPDGG